MPNWSEIPHTLRDNSNFGLWKREVVDGKTTKIPYQTNGRRASSTDPLTWGTFDTCYDAFRNGGFDGIGIFLAKSYGITGIDFDKCRNPNGGEIRSDVLDFIKRFDSYSEISVSGTGIHIIVFADHNGDRKRKGDIEIYDDKRFFVLTGDRIKAVSGEIEPRQDELNKLYVSIFGDNGQNGQDEPKQRGEKITDLSNEEVIRKASNAKNGDKFKRLFFEGDCSDYPSRSEADLALCDMLRFYCGDDPSRIDELFRQSELMRSKWNEKHGSQTYGELTIVKSLDSGDVYGGDVDSGVSVGSDRYFEYDSKGRKGRFVPKWLGDAILESNRFLHYIDTDDVLIYNPASGLYENDGDAIILQEAQERLGDDVSSHRTNEALTYIKNSSYVKREDVEMPLCLIPAANGVINISQWLDGDFTTLENLPVSAYTPNLPMFVKHRGAFRPELLDNPQKYKSYRFITSTFPPEELDTVQELIGACQYREQVNKKAFMLLGDGDNGKSVFLRLLTQALGSDVVSSQSLYAISNNNFAPARLYQKNANIFADLGGGDLKFTGIFMMLSAGDGFDASHKFKNAFHMNCYAVLIFSTNALPDVKNPPDQFYNRWILIDMPYRFVPVPDETKDFEKPRIPEHVLEPVLHEQDELDFVFTWGMAGLKRLLEKGHYTESNSTQAIKSRWITKTDSLHAFVNAMVEENAGSRIRKSIFKSEYLSWCGSNGMFAQSDAYIGKNLPRFIPTKWVDGKPERLWTDISIRGVASEASEPSMQSDGQTLEGFNIYETTEEDE